MLVFIVNKPGRGGGDIICVFGFDIVKYGALTIKNILD